MLIRLLVFAVVGFCFFCGLPLYAQQNLVANASFESRTDTVAGHANFEVVRDWYNVYPGGQKYPYGTPDCMYRPTETANPYDLYRPYDGLTVAGMITYLARIRNFREYIGTQLKEPLIVGESYQMSFYVSSGVWKTFGSVATNGFGFLLSTQPVYQRKHEPLSFATPQYTLPDVFYSTEWQQVTHTFVADSAYRFLTFGNFLKDYDLIKMFYRINDEEEQAYVFLDDVRLLHLPKPKPQPEVSTPQEPAAPPALPEAPAPTNNFVEEAYRVTTAPPIAVEGRPVFRQYQAPVSEKEIMLEIWDAKDEDGDIISIKFNGEWVLREYTVRKKPKRLKITLRDDANNYLILFAHNLGSSPPNTATINIRSGGKTRRLIVRSDLEKSGAVELVHQP